MLKKTSFYMMIIFLLIISNTGCNISNNTKSNVEKEVDYSEESGNDIYKQLALTNEESNYMDEIKAGGKLRIAIRELVRVYVVENDEKKGFHYNLIKEFADEMELELDILTIEFRDYWTIEGEIPDEVTKSETYSYTPDLIRDVHLYPDNITMLPWREKLVKFVPVHPIREVLVHNKNMNIKELGDLDKLRVVQMVETSYLLTLEKITEEMGYTFEYDYVQSANEIMPNLVDGLADFTVADINRAVVEVTEYDDLKIGIPVGEIKYIGWAVKKDNEILASILGKYIEYIKANGEFDRLWSEDYPIDFIEYMRLLSN